MIPEHIFRAYDIRGVYGTDLTEEIATRIGRALASYVDGEGKSMLVGRDVRLSSPPIGDALIKGLLAGGFDVEDIGTVTTPILYFSSVNYGRNGGVMVSASHNPPEWNGFKIWLETGFICQGKGMEELKAIALKGRFKESAGGRLKRNPNAIADYENHVAKRIDVERRMKVAADPGNGSCCLLIPRVFRKVGIDVAAINAEPDGSFPARPPDPTEEVLGGLKRLVLDEKADFGVGFDGDGDRAVFVDDLGRMVPSDLILVMLTEFYLKRQKGVAVVYEVSCSLNVEETVKACGGKPVLSQVGHTYIVDKMLKEKAVLGGETSGHFYFADMYGFDDALFAGLKVAEILSKTGMKLSEILDSLPKYPRIPIKNYECPDEKKFSVVEELAEDFRRMGYETVTIDGVKVVEDEGWLLIRPSNTQPLIRLTVEAKNKEALQRLAQFAEEKITEKIKKCR